MKSKMAAVLVKRSIPDSDPKDGSSEKVLDELFSESIYDYNPQEVDNKRTQFNLF